MENGRTFGFKEKERFRKIVGVMERATIEGERIAARTAAERMAAIYGLSLEEALDESHPDNDTTRISAKEREARKKDYEAWMASRMRWTEAQERAEKARFEQARKDAARRAAEARDAKQREEDARQAEEARREAEARAATGFARAGQWAGQRNGRANGGGYRYNSLFRSNTYKPSAQDRFRLISNLLKDGVSLRRVADLTGVSTNEVARVWLLIR